METIITIATLWVYIPLGLIFWILVVLIALWAYVNIVE